MGLAVHVLMHVGTACWALLLEMRLEPGLSQVSASLCIPYQTLCTAAVHQVPCL